MPRKKARREHKQTLVPCTERFLKMGIYAIRLSVLWINRSCKPANPAFTMSKEHGLQLRRQTSPDLRSNSVVFRRCGRCHPCEQGRKQGRSGMAWQPSRAVAREGWWSRSGSNRRPQACKARALPTELRPRIRECACTSPPAPRLRRTPFAVGEGWRATRSCGAAKGGGPGTS